MPLIELDNISCRYPGGSSNALSEIGLSVERGECVGLLGHNGAGKTTLLSIISGLQPGFSGRLSAPPALSIGLVPQTLAFYERLSVRENLVLFADLYGLQGSERTERLAATLERVGLAHKHDYRAARLSGGEKRRLNLALGILRPADLYLLDEATVGMDTAARLAVLALVEQLVAEGAAVIYTSHYLDEVERVAGRIVLLDAGRVALDLSGRELLGGDCQLLLEWPDTVPEGVGDFLPDGAREPVIQTRSILLAPVTLEDLRQLLDNIPLHLQPTAIRFGRPGLEQVYLARGEPDRT